MQTITTRTDAASVPARASRRRRGLAALVPATLVALLAAFAMPAVSQAYPPPEPPEVTAKITSPANGTHGLYGAPGADPAYVAFKFKASAITSPGSCGCTYKWSSNVDGPMGGGAALNYVFKTPGARTVTLTATYQVAGKTANDTTSIVVYADNVAPWTYIDEPAAGATLSKFSTYVLLGHAYDPNIAGMIWPGELPCSALAWRVKNNVTGFYLPTPAGCTPTVSFPAGSYTIYLTATDPYGLKGTASIQVTVQ